MAIPPGLSPGATAQALAASNTVSNAPRGGYLAALGRLGLQPSPAHYTAQGAIEGQVGAGQMTAGQAARLKGRDLTERGFSPMLGFVGAMPYQLFDEAFDPEASGQRSLSDALSQGWQNIRGVGDVVGERIRENPWGALSAIFSSQVTPGGGYTDEAPRALEGIFPGAAPTTILPEEPSSYGNLGYEPDADIVDWSKVEEDAAAGVFDADFDYIPAQVRSGVGGDLPPVPTEDAPYLGIAESPSMVNPSLYRQPNVQYGSTPPYDEGWSQRRMLGEPVARSPGEEYVTHRQEIADLKNVEHDYTSDLANWNRSQQAGSDDSDVAEAKYNVMKHLNLAYGARPLLGDSLKPDASADDYERQGMHNLMINTPSNFARDTAANLLDSSSTIQEALDDLSGQDQRVKVMDSLTDMANNATFRALRDERVSKEEAYKSEDVVWDHREMRDLAQELINEERDPETITVENVKEEAKKAYEKRTDVREEAREQGSELRDALKAEQDRIREESRVESFADMPEPEPLDPQVEDFSAIRDREAEAAAERDREAEEAAAERSRAAEAAAAERDRAAAKAAAERDRERANREREKAERQAEIARDERARASAERDRLEALSRQRDAERRVAEAERTRQEAEAAEERKRQQQRESAEKRREDLERAAVAQRQAEQERERLKQKNREAAAAANAKWARYNSTSWSRLPGETQLEYTQRMQRLGRGGGMYT